MGFLIFVVYVFGCMQAKIFDLIKCIEASKDWIGDCDNDIMKSEYGFRLNQMMSRLPVKWIYKIEVQRQNFSWILSRVAEN